MDLKSLGWGKGYSHSFKVLAHISLINNKQKWQPSNGEI